MKYAVAVLAAAAGVSANWAPNATVVTEVVDVYTTYCPGPTEITHGGKTWTVTEATTLTITDCPCTITKPVIPTSVVVCNTCGPNNNGTGVVPPVTATQPPATGGNPPPATQTPAQPGQPPVEGSAGKAVAGLAGVVGLAALIL